MVEEITVHEAVIAFRMLFRQAHVFVHVERYNVFEANLARFMHFYQCLIGSQRRAASRQTQHERTIGGRVERVDAVNDMTRGPFAHLFCCSQGNQSHCSPQ